MNRFINNSSILLIIILVSCNPSNNDNEFFITSNINNSPLLLDLINSTYIETWDMKFSNINGFYNIELNSSAGVMSINSGVENFENSTLPDSGFTYDSFTIGSNWVDSSSYNFQNHSIESRGETYFLWTSSYEFLKLQVIKGKTIISGELYQIIFKYNFLNQIEEGSIIDTIEYSNDVPYYFNFNTDQGVNLSNWDIGFSLTPIFSNQLQSYQAMPTILLNISSGIKVSIFENITFEEEIDTTNRIWYEDMNNQRQLGYGGTFQVIWYHPEPPYNHKAIIEYPNHIYLISNSNEIFKLMFNEYESGFLSYKYRIMK